MEIIDPTVRTVFKQKIVYKDEGLTLLANLKEAAQQDGNKKQELLELLKVNVGANYDEYQSVLTDLSKKKFHKNFCLRSCNKLHFLLLSRNQRLCWSNVCLF